MKVTVWKKGHWKSNKNPRWVPIGTKKINSYGYSKIKIAEHKWADEHRHIMAQHLGRKIKSSEIVHHKNGDRLDNHIDNLELLTVSEHMRHHGLERGGLNPKRVDKGITLT